MNLSAYDVVEEKLDRNKTWILVKSKEILSREIKKRRYYAFIKKWNPNQSIFEYFLLLLDAKAPNIVCHYAHIDNFGRLKLNARSIWDVSSLWKYDKTSNIGIEHIEHTDDGDIYKLDI